ncbi:hydroxymethylbilane synthase [Corynebacterium sp. sy017]|uniref:hydroxymethylbilane synthase n=1 Tax=unclassified Corynebacterium TaxID=2624378 RepID=UPI00118645A8|nr:MULTISPECIES: hydroxymethylbilane synthase [unclassified Corynebacterium]MBP3089323.1 hydroxymethylbilane synthase [Corynebacterium sp. sy017]QDZ43259.1 hydroxymethylbilane synthase [Corynebacterium sp. sy039]TSD90978.1 hydroxymethylbilane synthase [Corynebacterium sp. SY003]
MSTELLIGTRGSLLATTQAGHVLQALEQNGHAAQLHIVTTVGDVNMAPVERIGVGVFTQALREALAAGECDIAIHSFKDLPTARDPRFHLVVPTRADARDCLVARDSLTLAQLPQSAKVGTGAPRRISQLKALRPDLDIRPLRGNIDTRIAKVHQGELDAIVLAYAGLVRVGKQEYATEIFDPELFLPAPAQGALAIECRHDDERARAAISSVVDEKAQLAAETERRILQRLEAGCTAPVAAYAQVEQENITLSAAVISLDGTTTIHHKLTGAVNAAPELAEELTTWLLAQGAGDILY